MRQVTSEDAEVRLMADMQVLAGAGGGAARLCTSPATRWFCRRCGTRGRRSSPSTPGSAALTVGSHPVADSVGKADNEGMSFDDVLARVAQITGAVDVPVSVDIESGYGEPPPASSTACSVPGRSGLNIEDTVHGEGGRLRSSSEHAELVGALRAAADAAGVHVVINARTDLFLRQDGDESDRVDRADRAADRMRRRGRRRVVPGRPPRSGYVAALDFRAAAAGQRDRACRTRTIPRRSARSAWAGSASAPSCRRR